MMWARWADQKTHTLSVDPEVERKVRGGNFLGMTRYVQALPPKERATLEADLPPDFLAKLQQCKPFDYYPADDQFTLVAALARLDGEDEHAAYRRLVEVGRNIAEESVQGFLRFLIKFLTPGLLARKFPDIWVKDNTFGSLSATLSGNSFFVVIDDVEGYLYVGALTTGIIPHFLTQMGCADVTCVERLHPPGTPQTGRRYEFDIAWR